jgi:acyl-ACP thioesterase
VERYCFVSKPWTEHYKVRSSEADVFGDMTVPALCLCLQEAAWNHARTIDWGLSDGQTWVLARMAIAIDRLPVWDDPITVHTWPRGVERSFAMRDFQVVGSQDQVLVRASSAWIVIDMESRRPIRRHEFPPGVPLLPDRLALGRGPHKLSHVDPAVRRRIGDVQYGDLDVNGHVGYARYLGWVLGGYDVVFRSTHVPSAIEVNYLRECVEGDEIWLAASTAGDEGGLYAVLKGPDEEACRALVRFRLLDRERRAGDHLRGTLGIGSTS